MLSLVEAHVWDVESEVLNPLTPDQDLKCALTHQGRRLFILATRQSNLREDANVLILGLTGELPGKKEYCQRDIFRELGLCIIDADRICVL